MISPMARVDALLRGPSARVADPATPRSLVGLAVTVLLCGLFYGGVMGTYSGLAPGRLPQVAYSALKVPLLLLVTFGLSLPSFFVLNTLLGLRSDLREAVRALLSAQAGLTVILASFAPLTAFWYASSGDYDAATRFNLLMFGVATIASHGLLRRYYRPLLDRSRAHVWLLRGWLTAYGFVGIQMAWVLRPFVGDPDRPVQFFRDEAWGNAYVVVANLLWRLFTR
jgi:hypothetical protein